MKERGKKIRQFISVVLFSLLSTCLDLAPHCPLQRFICEIKMTSHDVFVRASLHMCREEKPTRCH